MASCITFSTNALSNSLIQDEEVSSTVFLPDIKIGCYEKVNNNPYQAQIDLLFNKIFNLCAEVKKQQNKSSKLTALDPSFSKENLNQTLNPLFIKNLLEKTRKEKIRSYLEQDPCCGEHWKELHAKSNITLSLQDLQKLHFCLENTSSNIQSKYFDLL